MTDLQGFLAGEGFLFAKDSCRSPVNECDWYAYRKIVAPMVDGDANQQHQLLIFPFQRGDFESIDISLVAEKSACWNLRAYSLSSDDVLKSLGEIEARLVAAWNALASTNLN